MNNNLKSLLKNINGYYVQYPIKFLSEENITYNITDKEILVGL